MPDWTVEHYEHEFTPVSVGHPEIKDDGALIQTVRPENLHFILNLGVVGPSEIDYEISLSALDEDGNPAVRKNDDGESLIAADRTDFALRRSDIGDPILAGMHTMVPDGQAGDECMKVAGKDWLHYLERRHWPYDAALSYVNWPDGFRFKVTAAEIGQIVKDILETVRDVSPNYPDPPDDDNPSYSLGFTVDVDDTGKTINFEIPPFESSSIYELVQQLSQMDHPAPGSGGGFDFYMSPAKVFRLVYPELGNPAAPIYTLEVDVASELANMLETGFTNTGPTATHVLGVGAGRATRQGGVNKHFRANSARYRRLDKIADFGDVKNLDLLESLTAAELSFEANPIHEIPITIDPNAKDADGADLFPGFWSTARPGKYIAVTYDLGFHKIDSVQKIVSMDCTADNHGNETVVLGLNQHYAVDSSTGLADW